MKKIIVLFSLVFMAGMVSAQCTKSASASKKCCAKKAATTVSNEASNVKVNEAQVASMIAEAEAAAEADESIEVRKCSTSNTTAFYRKSVCSMTGSVSSSEVKYCSESKGFVNVSPKDVKGEMDARVVPVSETGSAAKPACSKSAQSCAKKCTKNAVNQ